VGQWLAIPSSRQGVTPSPRRFFRAAAAGHALPAVAAGRLHEPALPPGGARAGRPRPGHHRSGQRPGPDGAQPQDDGADRSLPDRPVAVQIYGSNPQEMRDAAQWLEAYGVAAVDINMGCPVHKVVRGGGGSAMLCDPGATTALVRTVVEAVRLPVTVKMRLGW